MKIAEIKALAARVPFRPFVILLDSGREIAVNDHSELFFPPQRPELILIFTQDETWIFEAQGVSALRQA
jgi:hypothetical protein